MINCFIKTPEVDLPNRLLQTERKIICASISSFYPMTLSFLFGTFTLKLFDYTFLTWRDLFNKGKYGFTFPKHADAKMLFMLSFTNSMKTFFIVELMKKTDSLINYSSIFYIAIIHIINTYYNSNLLASRIGQELTTNYSIQLSQKYNNFHSLSYLAPLCLYEFCRYFKIPESFMFFTIFLTSYNVHRRDSMKIIELIANDKSILIGEYIKSPGMIRHNIYNSLNTTLTFVYVDYLVKGKLLI